MSRTPRLRRGTGIAVASRIDATAVGSGRSFRVDDEDWRVIRVLFGVLGSFLVDCVWVSVGRWPRLGGMTTGSVCTFMGWASGAVSSAISS